MGLNLVSAVSTMTTLQNMSITEAVSDTTCVRKGDTAMYPMRLQSENGRAVYQAKVDRRREVLDHWIRRRNGRTAGGS